MWNMIQWNSSYQTKASPDSLFILVWVKSLIESELHPSNTFLLGGYLTYALPLHQ